MSAMETWLADGAILAQLHIPESPASTTGVVICPPLAQEHILAYRTMRLLAEKLETSGIASVRFDYPGHGDSTAATNAYAPSEGIEIAADALHGAGCSRIVYVGLSVGALFAQEAARADPNAVGLVLWDPARSGRTWLRRARMLYASSVAGASLEPNPDGTVNIVGGELDPHSVDLIQNLAYDPPTEGIKVLSAVRREQKDELAQHASDAAASDSRPHLVAIDGHDQLLDVSSVIARIPGSSVDTVCDWIVTEFGPQNGSVTALRSAHPETLAVFDSSDADAVAHAELVEELVRVGPDRLFAIETRMSDAPPDAPALILQTGSAEHRVGPARYQVLQARQLAARGFRVLRVDRRGTGESGSVAADEPNLMYTTEWIEDNAQAIRRLGLPADRVGVVGLCVGGWLGLVTDPGAARLVVALCPGTYRVRPVQSGSGVPAPAQVSGGKPVIALLKKVLPYGAMLALARHGRAEMAELLLRPQVSAGCDVVLLLSPDDRYVFTEKFGERAATRMNSSGGTFTSVTFDTGDHALFEAGFRKSVLDEVSQQAERVLGRYLPESVERERERVPLT